MVKSLARTSTDQRESRCKTGYARAYASIALQEAHFRQLNVETRSRASQESNEAFGQRDFFDSGDRSQMFDQFLSILIRRRPVDSLVGAGGQVDSGGDRRGA